MVTEITNLIELQNISLDVNGDYILINDIDVSAGFTIINDFGGTLNGNGYNIINLDISNYRYCGIFSKTLATAVISNLNIINGISSGYQYIGMLVGQNRGTIINCHTSGTVSGNRAGGLVGNNQGGIILYCSSSTIVSGNDYNGGFVGVNTGNISYCFANGNVVGGEPSQAGGFVGWHESGNISNCYAMGDVWGHDAVGGFSALNWGTISKCYAIGLVTNIHDHPVVKAFTQTNVGAVIDCYCDYQTAAAPEYFANKRTTAEMTYIHASNTYVGWDFIIIWDIASGVNLGYPTLRLPLLPSTYTISGTTFDDSNNILPDTTIDINGQIITTDENGYYSIIAEPGIYEMTASKEGYVNDSATVEVIDSDLIQDFILTKIEEECPECPVCPECPPDKLDWWLLLVGGAIGHILKKNDKKEKK